MEKVKNSDERERVLEETVGKGETREVAIVESVVSFEREATFKALEENFKTRERQLKYFRLISNELNWEIAQHYFRACLEGLDKLEKLVNRGGELTLVENVGDKLRFEELSKYATWTRATYNVAEARGEAFGAQLINPKRYAAYRIQSCGEITMDNLCSCHSSCWLATTDPVLKSGVVLYGYEGKVIEDYYRYYYYYERSSRYVICV